MFPIQGARVQSLVGELDPTCHDWEFAYLNWKIPHSGVKIQDSACCNWDPAQPNEKLWEGLGLATRCPYTPTPAVLPTTYRGFCLHTKEQTQRLGTNGRDNVHVKRMSLKKKKKTTAQGNHYRANFHHWIHVCCVYLVAQSHPTLCDPMDGGLPDSCSWGFSRQEYWCGLPCPPPGHLPNPEIEPRSPTLQVDSLLSEPPGKPMANFKWSLCPCNPTRFF